MADANLQVILQQLEAEKSIDRDKLLEAIRTARSRAKSFHPKAEIVVEVDPPRSPSKSMKSESWKRDRRSPEMPSRSPGMNAEGVSATALRSPPNPRILGASRPRPPNRSSFEAERRGRENVYDEFKQRKARWSPAW